jgi:hypothetical protein
VRKAKNESLEKRLRAYAAGAGAVATGLLAFSPLASGEIVVVPAHVTITRGSAPFAINVGGTTEFNLGDTHSHHTLSAAEIFFVAAVSGAGVVHGQGNQVAALKFGAVIGPVDKFLNDTQLLALDYSGRFGTAVEGPFANTADRFLGLEFTFEGQVHYGWVGFSTVRAEFNNVTATLTAYAYETEPNTPIYAGQSSDSPDRSGATIQPATLGTLALGHLGLDVWRKRETAFE